MEKKKLPLLIDVGDGWWVLVGVGDVGLIKKTKVFIMMIRIILKS